MPERAAGSVIVRSDEAGAQGVGDGVRAVAQLQPGGHVVQDVLDRPLRVGELVGDLARVQPVGEQDTQEIASTLNYSERTVKGVIHEITTRLQLRNRSHAVAFALRNDLI